MAGQDTDDPTTRALQGFARRRLALNESLEEARKAIDFWFERQPQPVSMSALANLELLLKTRRDLLTQLVTLDDDFMDHLIQMRSGASGSEE